MNLFWKAKGPFDFCRLESKSRLVSARTVNKGGAGKDNVFQSISAASHRSKNWKTKQLPAQQTECGRDTSLRRGSRWSEICDDLSKLRRTEYTPFIAPVVRSAPLSRPTEGLSLPRLPHPVLSTILAALSTNLIDLFTIIALAGLFGSLSD